MTERTHWALPTLKENKDDNCDDSSVDSTKVRNVKSKKLSLASSPLFSNTSASPSTINSKKQTPSSRQNSKPQPKLNVNEDDDDDVMDRDYRPPGVSRLQAAASPLSSSLAGTGVVLGTGQIVPAKRTTYTRRSTEDAGENKAESARANAKKAGKTKGSGGTRMRANGGGTLTLAPSSSASHSSSSSSSSSSFFKTSNNRIHTIFG